MSLFEPSLILESYLDLNINNLKKIGIKVLLIDIDNTIALPSSGSLSSDAKKFIINIKNNGITPVIFSNNNKNRVSSFVGDFDVDWYYFALKPLSFRFKKIFKSYDIKANECAVIGDQLLTDILGANLNGCYGIYSKQLVIKDTFITSINRKIEKLIWKYILHDKYKNIEQR